MSAKGLQSTNQFFNKEVRFAVVMYGGVSLAIYINGVAQELLKMCRATKFSPNKLSSTEKFYHEIACLLADEDFLETLSQIKTEKEIEEKIARKLRENPLNVKFVVDVLTGTSAGGINAIFLAKALANNQEISSLKDLWIEQGDIGRLINDKKSVADNNLSVPEKAKSLLNSDRMFVELIKAFEGMDEPNKDKTSASGEERKEAVVDEIDLFVTTTDFKGVVVPLRLMDKVVEEKSFRQSFHFRFDRNSDKNDFTKEHNPMLGFASRATSSFPFAFEPMRLSSALKVIRQCFDDGIQKANKLEADAEKFFPKIVEKNGKEVEWKDRDLIDGGVLDNKPFSHAISILSERRADFQVERKLLYIEPSPESFANETQKNNEPPPAPDALDNALASLSSIPGYETIRQDLERLTERNRLIERVNSIISNAEQDVFEQLTTNGEGIDSAENGWQSNIKWEDKGLEEIAKLKGRAVLPYYRLRIAALTDEITRLVTHILGVDENSEYFAAVRDLIKVWRIAKYKDYQKEDQKETVLAYLKDYDLIYRLRRLRFVQQKLNRLYVFDQDFKDEIDKRREKFEEIRKEAQTKSSRTITKSFREEAETSEEVTESPFVEENLTISLSELQSLQSSFVLPKSGKTNGSTVIERKPSEILSLIGGKSKDNNYQEQIQKSVNYFLLNLSEVYTNLLKGSKSLQNHNQETTKANKKTLENDSQEILDKFYEKLGKIGGKIRENLPELLELAKENSENIRIEKIKGSESWKKFEEGINSAADELKKILTPLFDDARTKINGLLKTVYNDLWDKKGLENIEPIIFDAVRGYLKHYYQNFDEYDQMSYPIFYQTQVGEAAKVEVMRISPTDATGLIDLSKSATRQKVAGESLFHFGAFLDATWRWNDIMWGRLDGAERLITALLPDSKFEDLRKFFTKKMHLQILKEEFLTANNDELRKTFAESMAKTSSGLPIREVVGKITKKISDDVVKKSLEGILKTLFTENDAYKYIQEDYAINKKLEPKPLLEVISRSTNVTGDILGGIADKNGIEGNRLRVISRLGKIFWGLVQVAAPNSIWNMLLGHWLVLLYFFEVLLLAATTIFAKPDIQQFATVLLALTLIVHLCATALHDYMRGGKIISLLKFFAIGVLSILVGAGVLSIYAFFYDEKIWTTLTEFHGDLTKMERWQKLIPLSVLVMLVLVIFTWRDTKNPRIRFYGVMTFAFAILAVAVGGLMTWLVGSTQEINGLPLILALEFVKDGAEVQKIAEAAGQGLKNALLVDSFVFIPLYTAFMLFFSGLFNLWKTDCKIGKDIVIKGQTLLKVSAILVFIAAFSDIVENYFSYLVLQLPENDITWQDNVVRYSATIKWLALSLVTAALSFVFLRKNWLSVPFLIGFLLTAVLGIVGLFEHQYIQHYLKLLIGLLAIVGVVFVIAGDKIKEEREYLIEKFKF